MTAEHSAATDDQGAAIALLADPTTHDGHPVERIDTHGAHVFLAGERAYKLKRAVSFPFMDFSTPERRIRCARREIELNRRTAPMLYLGVAPIQRTESGDLALGEVDAPLDEAIEAVVVMRRFDQDLLFDRLARSGRLEAPTMIELADGIADFHLGRSPGPEQDLPAKMRWVADDNIAEMRDYPEVFPSADVEELMGRSRAAVERLTPTLAARARDGFVRHCHGDLHLRNICLIDERPVLFDCIEFNDDLAVIDVAYDFAFLIMDLIHRGLDDLANAVLNRYLERTGDYAGLVALPFYVSLRAAIRAKVLAVAAATNGDDAGKRRSEAGSYLRLALAALGARSPRLVVIGGLSGTGKSTVARDLAPALGDPPGALILRSDITRKRLLGVEPAAPLGPDGYTPEVTDRTYGELARLGALALDAGFAVIIDAVCGRPSERAAFERLAQSRDVPFAGLWLTAPGEILIARTADRHDDASDAGPEVVRKQLEMDVGPVDWPEVDAAGAPGKTVARAKALIEA